MHNHFHNHCNHSLQYCGVCDVVYCTKCGKEWSATWKLNWYPSWSGTGASDYQVTYDSNTKVTGHSHG